MKLLARITVLCLFALAPISTARADEAANKAAEELLLAMKADKSFAQSIDQVVDLQVKQNPQIEKFRPVLKKFFDKHMSWDAVKSEMIALYAKEFTTEELQEMVKFYKSPVGQKMAEKTPILTAKSMDIGMRRLQANQAELQEMLKAESMK